MRSRLSIPVATVVATAVLAIAAAPSSASSRITQCGDIDGTTGVSQTATTCSTARTVAKSELKSASHTTGLPPKTYRTHGFVCRREGISAADGWIATCSRGTARVYVTPQ